MRLLNQITDDAYQQFTLIGEEGEQISFLLYFMPTQNAWMCNMTWDDFTVTGFQILVGPNILRQWKNVITFGLACTSTDGYDPQYINDFQTGRIQLYLLNTADVQTVEDLLFD